MTIDAVSEMTNNALYVIIKVSLPVLLVSLIVGLVISIFLTLVLLGSWMMNIMVEYTVQLWSSFSQYVHR